MVEPKSHIEIAFRSINVFADDGQLDVGEINFLLGLALRDQTIDDDERRVLAKVFSEAEKSALPPAVQTRIDEVRRKHGVPVA
ncbi:hypothetical protein [Tahibacter amnicola]|uniref:Tellurite resistance protein TerB n=1 Tax=Tahibacter amnicola TaxID=2976241 RepID=A0ABY6BFV5_9GAMM|nr:hypothetical protein [Tahibacter amnicola]UXI68158.1 hypothetical protein N4264_00450 [Tahibacter amnicola]